MGVCYRIAAGKVATHRVAQDVNPLQPHRHPPGFDRGDKLSLSRDRILVVLRVGATTEPQYVDRVHRPVVGNRIEIEHPQPHTRSESVQQQDGNVFRLPVQCHRAYLIVRPDTLTHFDEDTFKGFPKGCKRRVRSIIKKGAKKHTHYEWHKVCKSHREFGLTLREGQRVSCSKQQETCLHSKQTRQPLARECAPYPPTPFPQVVRQWLLSVAFYVLC